jgi:hypothetical protein
MTLITASQAANAPIAMATLGPKVFSAINMETSGLIRLPLLRRGVLLRYRLLRGLGVDCQQSSNSIFEAKREMD